MSRNVMQRLNILAAVWSFAICGMLACVSIADDKSVVDAFVDHVKNSKHQATESVLATVRQESNPSEAITSALKAMYPDYSAGIAASDDDNIELAVQKLSPFVTSEDKFLAADASFYLARTLMNHERFEEAMPLLTSLQSSLAENSTQTAVVQYYIGQSLAGMLENEKAVAALMEFLQTNPDAPERLRVSAWRQIQDLQNINPGKMEDVYHRMDYSRRRLKIVESGDKTQEEQNNVVKMLAKLIQEQEKKECSSCNSKKNCPNPKESQGEKQAKNDPKESKSQSGGNSSNPNGKFVEKSFDTGNASPWSRLRGMDRDPANAGIKEKLPARYKEIVERYNDAVNGNTDKSDEKK
ncbi:MAG: hypothetical protein ABL888_21605 [Pirellulaceae bacterium]